ncbi:putative amino acid ABC transporter periplasmic component [Oleiphilus messinensis]|uniref:Putative amino acid ABC transporter periplasmic component n=1 Tax=Oleiphilus messinensis TaxID=141451 RepID=A0A1Y0I9K0_9GAMM|nr:transporter substrate-binding domain-containing protein [Oleiphilus messinensis]ARU56829.1 putative amino acid ABC transporter periplasmic component [Oleiphilus messinensis]
MNYPPFYGEKMEDKGPLIEIIVRALESQGYKTRILFSPWKRAMLYAKEGKVADGMVGVWYNDDRAEDFIYSAPIFPNRSGFYKHKEQNIVYTDYQDLVKQGYRLGSVIGYIHPKGLEESGIQIEWVPNDIQNLKKLALKRVDLVVVDREYARYVLKGLPDIASRIEWMDPVLIEAQQHLIISRKTKNAHVIIDAFNTGLELLRQTGNFDEIIQKHGLKPQ